MWRRLLALASAGTSGYSHFVSSPSLAAWGRSAQGAPANSAKNNYTRALQYLSIGAAEAAVKELNDALKLDPTNAEFHHLLAFALSLRGTLSVCAEPLCQSVGAAPGYAEAHVHLAACIWSWLVGMMRWQQRARGPEDHPLISTGNSLQ